MGQVPQNLWTTLIRQASAHGRGPPATDPTNLQPQCAHRGSQGRPHFTGSQRLAAGHNPACGTKQDHSRAPGLGAALPLLQSKAVHRGPEVGAGKGVRLLVSPFGSLTPAWARQRWPPAFCSSMEHLPAEQSFMPAWCQHVPWEGRGWGWVPTKRT